MTTIDRLYRDEPDVLLVEDDPKQCMEFEEFFRRLGVSYRIANDGIAAIRILEETAPRMVLLDIRLPGTSGIEVAKTVLRRVDRPVVVLMSGHIESVFEANQSAAKAFRVLEKPVDLRLLARFIGEVVSRRRRRATKDDGGDTAT